MLSLPRGDLLSREVRKDGDTFQAEEIVQIIRRAIQKEEQEGAGQDGEQGATANGAAAAAAAGQEERSDFNLIQAEKEHAANEVQAQARQTELVNISCQVQKDMGNCTSYKKSSGY